MAAPFTSSPRQTFKVTKSENGLAISMTGTNKSFDIEGGSDNIFAPVLIYVHKGSNNQLFEFKQIGQELYQIENIHSRKVLEIEGGIDVEGMPIVQNIPYRLNKNQQWFLKTV